MSSMRYFVDAEGTIVAKWHAARCRRNFRYATQRRPARRCTSTCTPLDGSFARTPAHIVALLRRDESHRAWRRAAHGVLHCGEARHHTRRTLTGRRGSNWCKRRQLGVANASRHQTECGHEGGGHFLDTSIFRPLAHGGPNVSAARGRRAEFSTLSTCGAARCAQHDLSLL